MKEKGNDMETNEDAKRPMRIYKVIAIWLGLEGLVLMGMMMTFRSKPLEALYYALAGICVLLTCIFVPAFLYCNELDQEDLRKIDDERHRKRMEKIRL